MNAPTLLTGPHRRTYEAIFRHPIAPNLAWPDVFALLAHLGRVAEQPNGTITVTRNGQVLVLRPSRTKDVREADEIMKLRRFLERSEPPVPEAAGKESQWLVVIDHHEARIFRSVTHGTIPLQVFPYQPDDFFRRAPNAEDFSHGREKPNENVFFTPVAKSLKNAGKILIFGNGTGSSNEMVQFIAWLKLNQPDLAQRVIGSQVIDGHHLTEAQILALARDYYANPTAARLAQR